MLPVLSYYSVIPERLTELLPLGAKQDNSLANLISNVLETFTSIGSADKGLSSVIQKTIDAIKNPAQYRKEIALIVGIIMLLILIMLMGSLLLAAVRKRAEMREIMASVQIRSRNRTRIAGIIAALSILIVAILLCVYTSTSPAFCRSCHQIKSSYDTWHGSAHRRFACLKCHSEPGAAGFLKSYLEGFDNLLRYKSDQKIAVKAKVGNRSCLKCHSDIYRITKIGTVSVKHKEIIDANIRCTDCHQKTSHGKEQRAFVMGKCAVCHNDQDTAKAKCEGCHNKDIAMMTATKLEDYPKVDYAGIRCYSACHSAEVIKLCMDCHGLLMPHPGYFKGIHASVAMKRPLLCNRCHGGIANWSGEHCGCHTPGDVHGKYQEWFPMHKNFARNYPIGCTCHKPGFCTNCHDFDSNRDQY